MHSVAARADLNAALPVMALVGSTKTSIPILNHVLIQAEGNSLALTCTDLDIAIRTNLQAAVGTPGSITIPADRLTKLVKLLPDGNIDLKGLPNNHMEIKAGRSRSKLPGLAAASFPEIPSSPDPIFTIDAESLASLFSVALLCVSTEASRFTLNGALLKSEGGKLTIVSTDGHRLVHYSAGDGLPKMKNILVAQRAMNMVLKLISASDAEEVKVSSDDNHLFFEIGAYQMVCRKLTGTFPDYDRVLPKGMPIHVDIPRSEAREALRRVILTADERSRSVKLTFNHNELLIESSTTEVGETEETLAIEYSGEPLSITLNGTYLLDIMDGSTDETVTVYMKDPQTAADIHFTGGRYIVMPMRG